MYASMYLTFACINVVSQVQHARALTKVGAGDRDAPRALMGDRWAGGGGDRDGPCGDRPGGGGGGGGPRGGIGFRGGGGGGIL